MLEELIPRHTRSLLPKINSHSCTPPSAAMDAIADAERTSTSPSPAESCSASTFLFNLFSALGFLFFTANVINSALHSLHQPAMLAFILFSYFDLALLFFCLSRFHELGPDSPAERRRNLNAAIWLLATALNLAVAWRVAQVMPWPLAVAIWAMSASVALGCFYLLFLYKEQDQGYCAFDSTENEKLGSGINHSADKKVQIYIQT